MNRVLSLVVVMAVFAAPTAQAQAATPPASAEPEPAPAQPAASEGSPDAGRGKTVKIWGGITLGTGLVVIAASGITWGLRNTAIRRANRQKFYVDEQRLIDRARRRHTTAVVGLGVGTSLALIGTALLITGAVVTQRERRAAFTPVLTPGYAGVAASLRF
ncbi:MAG: hypothetical protein JKY37_19965 [Nannocystaceae bacterium]|nr:hypothetical protein [Nannocystaceae bacterium]